jgi:hypothetical protein
MSPDLRTTLEPSKDEGSGQLQSSEWAAGLAQSVEVAETGTLADAVVGTWREIAVALGPIIGRGGVAALYRRSLSLAANEHPWLKGACEEVESPMDLAALRLVLVQQGSASTAAGGGALLQAFHDLVFSLLGASLVERLLGNIWALPVRSKSASPICASAAMAPRS